MAFVRINTPSDFPKIKKEIKKETERLVKKADTKWSKDARPIAKKEIKDAIESGYSPVAGGGGQTGGKSRFEKYSTSYTRAMGKGKLKGKRPSPVNMTLSGDMLQSLASRVFKGNKGFTLWFTSRLANFHNDKGVKSKAGQIIRRLLPLNGRGEELSLTITNKLEKEYKKIFNKIK